MIDGRGDSPAARLDALAFAETRNKSVKWEILKVSENRFRFLHSHF